MKKINIVLVTGGAGFIGSHTCLSLLERGYKVIILDSFVNSSRKSVIRIKEIIRKFKSLQNYDLSIYEYFYFVVITCFCIKFFCTITRN